MVSPRDWQVREVDKLFLDKLTAEMKKDPTAVYEPTFVLAKGVWNKASFKSNQVELYEYYVHNTLAAQSLHAEDPEKLYFKTRLARIFVGLERDEAVFVGARHNVSGSFRHEMTFKEEV